MEKKLTTYSITKKPTRTLSIIAIATTASGYSSGVPDSSKDWNSGKVPRTKVNVETSTTPKEVKAIIVGVVGFWVGVFGMGLVFMLVVYLRRILRRVQNQPKNDSMLINKVSND